MAKKVLVFLEQRDGKLKKASFEASKLGSELAGKLGVSVEAVCIGGEIENLELVGGYGIPKVIHIKNPELNLYSPSAYGELLTNYFNESDADIAVFTNTSLGKDLAPRLSAKIDAGIVVDCTELRTEGDDIIAVRPVYAGKALLEVKINSDKKIFTLRPNVFNPGEPDDSKAEIEVKAVADLNLNTKVTSIQRSEGKLDVAEAEFIVSGGRGLKGPEHFNLIESLAHELGAAVGASRAVVDAGWRPHSEQVGQTGKTVSPTLYIAVGISGAIQHLAGMRSSKYIVAINKDKDAPIFQVADYGIAGDAFEILPALIEEIKKVKSN